MSFDWEEYLNVAKELAGKKTTPPINEAKLRAAISRAYYAAYGKATWHLVNNEFERNLRHDGSSHELVQKKYLQLPKDGGKEIAEYLYRLHVERKKADYRDTFGNLFNQANLCLNWSDRIMELIAKL